MTIRFICSICFLLIIGSFEIQGQNKPSKRAGSIGIDVPEPVIKVDYGNSNSMGLRHTNAGKRLLMVNDTVISQIPWDEAIVLSPVGFIVRKDKKYGFISRKALEILKPQYDTVYQTNGNFLIAANKGLYGAFDLKGKSILPLKYKKILASNTQKYFLVDHGAQYNLVYPDRSGEYRELKEIEKAYLYSNAAILKSKGKFVLFSMLNDQAFNFIYDTISIADIGSAGQMGNRYKQPRYYGTDQKLFRVFVSLAGKIGMIDSLNKVLIPIEQDKIQYEQYRGYYQITQGKKLGVYLTKCNQYIAPEYDRVYMDGTTFIQLGNGRLNGLMDDANGKMILPIEYDHIMKEDTVFIVTKNKLKGMVNTSGRFYLPIKYTHIDNMGGFLSHSYDGLFKVQIDSLSGVVDARDSILIPIQYRYIWDFEDSFILVTQGKKYGLYDLDGIRVQDVKYNYISRKTHPNSQIFITHRSGYCGALDRTGKEYLKNEYYFPASIQNTSKDLEPLDRFQNEDFRILKHQNGKFGIIEMMSGKIVLPLVYDSIIMKMETYKDSGNVFLVAIKSGKYGIVDINNNTILDFKYDFLSLENSYIAIEGVSWRNIALPARMGKLFGIVDLTGKQLLPFIYKDIRKLDGNNLFKVKKENTYVLMNQMGKVLNPGPFNEIGEFEFDEMDGSKYALSFFSGKMRMIDGKGKFLTSEITMKPHQGFTSFVEMKQALSLAMNSKNDSLVYLFAKSIMPSDHLMYFYKDYEDERYEKFKDPDYDYILRKYYEKLLDFKYHTWNSEYFNQSTLQTEDYTTYEDGLITVGRTEDWAYDDTRILEKFLRHCIKINGYWISGYFLYPNFYN